MRVHTKFSYDTIVNHLHQITEITITWIPACLAARPLVYAGMPFLKLVRLRIYSRLRF